MLFFVHVSRSDRTAGSCLLFDRIRPGDTMLHRETNVLASEATMQWEPPEACRCTLAKALNRKNAKANRSARFRSEFRPNVPVNFAFEVAYFIVSCVRKPVDPVNV